jgi:putative hydrolase of HD superfamily
VESFNRVVLALLDQVNHLKRLPRAGWLLAGVGDVESVADHTCAAALLALILAEIINADWSAHGLESPLDLGRVARLALIHDLAEAALTDLPRRSAELLGAEVKHRAEQRALTQMFVDLPNHETYLQLWSEYEGVTTPEARLVRDADKLEMVHQALWYERRGQRNLKEFWHGHRWHYAVSHSLFDELRRARELPS